MTVHGSGDFSIGSRVWPGAAKLLEELGELQQVIGKLIATRGVVEHWDGSNLRERLIEEVGDVRAAIDFFQVQNFNTSHDAAIQARRDKKYRTFQDWHADQGGKTP